MPETRINRMYDVRLISIGGGADEIMLGIMLSLRAISSKRS